METIQDYASTAIELRTKGKRTPEYIKFQNNYDILSRILATHLSPDELANELFAAHLIVEGLKSRVNYVYSDKTVRINDLNYMTSINYCFMHSIINSITA